MTDFLTVLRQAFPPEVVLVEPGTIEGYRRDASAGGDPGIPAAVVRPTSGDQVSAALRTAHDFRVPVVTRGAGTGLSGGAIAVDGCLLISTERLTSVAVDPAARVVVAGAGATNAEVKRAAAEHGLWYPPDPSSYETSSIGGNVATNAGGLCCVKYGVTADYVLGLRAVLVDGTEIRLGGPLLKDVAGLPLARLLVGSEGTLGVITEATLRLVPARGPVSTVVASFPSLPQAADAVVSLRATVEPALLELLDQMSINAVEDMARMGLDRSAAALLVAQTDSAGTLAGEEARAIADVFERYGATEVYRTDDPEEGAAMVAARRAALPALERLGDILLEDVGVPLRQLPHLLAGITRISKRHGLPIAVVAHAGDGNTRPVIVFDRASEASSSNARGAFDEVMDLAIGLGGTISGEHGIGRLKQPWLGRQLGADVLALNRRVKAAFDPLGLLNPGAVL